MTRTLFLLGLPIVCLGLLTAATRLPDALLVDGGPQHIVLSGLSSGDITRATWNATRMVEVHGCAAAPIIVACTLRFKDCNGKPVTAKNEGAGLTAEMRSMVSKLPDGTPFTVSVVAQDVSGRDMPMPEASFVIRR